MMIHHGIVPLILIYFMIYGMGFSIIGDLCWDYNWDGYNDYSYVILCLNDQQLQQ